VESITTGNAAGKRCAMVRGQFGSGRSHGISECRQYYRQFLAIIFIVVNYKDSWLRQCVLSDIVGV
jgi:hypothetical protein